MMEYWNSGMMGGRFSLPQYSNIPLFHHSNLVRDSLIREGMILS